MGAVFGPRWALPLGGLLGAGLAGLVAVGLGARALPRDEPVLIMSSTCGPSVQVAEDPKVMELVREGRIDVRVTDATEGPPLERCAEALGWPGVGRRHQVRPLRGPLTIGAGTFTPSLMLGILLAAASRQAAFGEP